MSQGRKYRLIARVRKSCSEVFHISIKSCHSVPEVEVLVFEQRLGGSNGPTPKRVVMFGRSIEGVIDALTRSGGECGRGID
jgi:hypothetical protein